MAYHLFGRAGVGQTPHAHDHLLAAVALPLQKLHRLLIAACN